MFQLAAGFPSLSTPPSGVERHGCLSFGLKPRQTKIPRRIPILSYHLTAGLAGREELDTPTCRIQPTPLTLRVLGAYLQDESWVGLSHYLAMPGTSLQFVFKVFSKTLIHLNLLSSCKSFSTVPRVPNASYPFEVQNTRRHYVFLLPDTKLLERFLAGAETKQTSQSPLIAS